MKRAARDDGSTKARLVLDQRRSGYSRLVQVRERVVLPRLADLTLDVQELAAHEEPDMQVYLGVCDFQDAFYSLGLHPSEWRTGCGQPFAVANYRWARAVPAGTAWRAARERWLPHERASRRRAAAEELEESD